MSRKKPRATARSVFVEFGRARGLAVGEDGEQLVGHFDFDLRRLVAALGRLLRFLAAALDRREVCEGQLDLDGLDVAARVDRAFDVDDVLVLEAADDLYHGVGLADVGEELVAEPLALRRAADEPGDVHELDRRGDDGRRLDYLCQRFEPLVGDGDDADVGLDGGEGVVGGERRRLRGERVEECGLADVREPDDTCTEHTENLGVR